LQKSLRPAGLETENIFAAGYFGASARQACGLSFQIQPHLVQPPSDRPSKPRHRIVARRFFIDAV